jgi:Nucleotidyl transferase of unknown function (DUF2204)
VRSYEKDMKKARSMNEFCEDILRLLTTHRIEFLVGGYDAFRHHTGIDRVTKDFDLVLRPSDVNSALELCRAAGYRAELMFSHWLAKIQQEEYFIDLIFNSGNGLCAVDDEWFSRAVRSVILGQPVKIIPLEELLWQKAFIMERERFDGPDIAHLLLKSGAQVDWDHLITRFGPNWRVLFSHLLLFGFIYPSKKKLIPRNVIDEFQRRLYSEIDFDLSGEDVCNGTFLSRSQYAPDVELDRFKDGRLNQHCAMTPDEIKEWTAAGAMEEQNRNMERG